MKFRHFVMVILIWDPAVSLTYFQDIVSFKNIAWLESSQI